MLFRVLLAALVLSAVSVCAENEQNKTNDKKTEEQKKADDQKKTQDDKKQDKKQEQKSCPIDGYAIDKKYHFDYKGKRIYSCGSKECMEKLKAEPETYLKKLEEQGVVLAAAPAGEKEKEKGKDKNGKKKKS